LNVTDRKGDRPFTPEEVECVTSIANMAAVALHNEMHRTRLEEFVQGLLLTVGRLAEFRDDETATHLERVQRYVEILAKQMRKSPKFSAMIDDLFIRHLVACSPMHDIGKVGIPDGILLKPGPLTTDEYEIMQRHVEIGRETVSFAMQRTGPNPLLNMCLDVIAGHHEAWDGTGYPRGRIGEAIPLAARIVSLADAYDAITSRRPYKEPRSHEEAEKIVRRESGFQFDPDVVEAFLARIDDFRRIQAEAHGIQENVAPQVAVPV
jgi:putative two-component system response regulator